MSVPHAYAFREIEGEIAGQCSASSPTFSGTGREAFGSAGARACRGHQPPVRARAAKMSANFKWVVNTLITGEADGGNGMHMENVALWMHTPTAAFARSVDRTQCLLHNICVLLSHLEV